MPAQPEDALVIFYFSKLLSKTLFDCFYISKAFKAECEMTIGSV
jgi:hypothetical protein